MKKFIIFAIALGTVMVYFAPDAPTLEELRDNGTITEEQYAEKKEREEARVIREKQAQWEDTVERIAKKNAVAIIKSALKDPRSYEEEFYYFNFDDRKMQIGFYATNSFGASVWEGYEFDIVLGGERVATPVYVSKIRR